MVAGSPGACFAHLLFREDYISSSDRVDKYGSIGAVLSSEAIERLGKIAEKVSGVFDKSRPELSVVGTEFASDFGEKKNHAEGEAISWAQWEREKENGRAIG
jgi:hypothetical protein